MSACQKAAQQARDILAQQAKMDQDCGCDGGCSETARPKKTAPKKQKCTKQGPGCKNAACTKAADMAVDIINATADFSDGIPEFTFEDYRRVRMLCGVDPKALGFGKIGGFKPVGVRNGGGADESTYTGGSGGSSSGSSSRSASGHTTWSDRGFYMADDSWDSQHLRVLDKAFDQINKNIDIVQDYFQELFFSEDVSQSGVCVNSLLTGGSLGRRLHITRAELAGTANGRTFPGSPYIKLDENYVRAVANTWEAQLFCGSGTGTCNCVVSDLSALIIHETTHSCFSGERMAYIIAQWWRWQYAIRNDYSSVHCCGNQVDMELESWDPSHWTMSKLMPLVTMDSWNLGAAGWQLGFCNATGGG